MCAAIVKAGWRLRVIGHKAGVYFFGRLRAVIYRVDASGGVQRHYGASGAAVREVRRVARCLKCHFGGNFGIRRSPMWQDSRLRRAGRGLDGFCMLGTINYAGQPLRGRIAAVSTVWRCYGPYTRTRAPAHTRIGNTNTHSHTHSIIITMGYNSIV